jgi:hypothetical protein
MVVICAVVAGFVAVFATLHSTGAPRPAEPGMLPYTPSRIEWLALELEASYRQDFSRDSDYDLHYLAKPPSTILIFIHYRSTASAGTVDYAINTAKQLASQGASIHRWSSWVKVEVQRKAVPASTKNK